MVNDDIATTGTIEIASSSLEGTIFQMDIKRNFSLKNTPEPGSPYLPEKFGITSTAATDKNSTLNEWNSLFAINDDCNADWIFRGGEVRDLVFADEMVNYLNRNWYGKLQDHLWGDIISNTSVPLASRDPGDLKRTILYSLYYLGASDDILNLGRLSYPYPPSINQYSTSIRWSIGVGAYSFNSAAKRYLVKETVFLPPIGEYRNVNRVLGLGPRASYAASAADNLALTNLTGATT